MVCQCLGGSRLSTAILADSNVMDGFTDQHQSSQQDRDALGKVWKSNQGPSRLLVWQGRLIPYICNLAFQWLTMAAMFRWLEIWDLVPLLAKGCQRLPVFMGQRPKFWPRSTGQQRSNSKDFAAGECGEITRVVKERYPANLLDQFGVMLVQWWVTKAFFIVDRA